MQGFRSFMLEAGNLVQHKKKAMEKADIVESRQDAILRSFLKLVWRYYKLEHNVDFYALKLCISSKHLSKVVRSRFGKTSKKSIQDISSELHFSEMSSFCKFFKKHTGMSPTAYRTRHSNMGSQRIIDDVAIQISV